MRAVTHRGSSLPSGSYRTRTARHLEDASVRSTTHRRAGYRLTPRGVQLLLADASGAPNSRFRRQPHGRRIVIPFVQTQVLGFLLGGLWSFDHNGVQGPPRAWHRARLLPQRTMGKGPPSPLGGLRLVPALPRSVGLGPIRSPQNVPCPWSVAACHSQSTPSNSCTPPPGLEPTFGAPTEVPTHR